MAKTTLPKKTRNKNIVKYRDTKNKDGKAMTFRSIGKIFNISAARVHGIYQREKKRTG